MNWCHPEALCGGAGPGWDEHHSGTVKHQYHSSIHNLSLTMLNWKKYASLGIFVNSQSQWNVQVIEVTGESLCLFHCAETDHGVTFSFCSLWMSSCYFCLLSENPPAKGFVLLLSLPGCSFLPLLSWRASEVWGIDWHIAFCLCVFDRGPSLREHMLSPLFLCTLATHTFSHVPTLQFWCYWMLVSEPLAVALWVLV